MSFQTYRNLADPDGPRKVLDQASDEALNFYRLLKGAMQAEAALDAAVAAVPEYTGHLNPIDYWGDEAEAFNRAVDALYEAVRTAE